MLLGVVATIQIFVFPEHWAEHLLWASLLLLIFARGAGVVSLDYVAAACSAAEADHAAAIDRRGRYHAAPRRRSPQGRRCSPCRRPHVVILGAGFGGLNAAIGLRKAPVDVTVIDRRNYHLFQPLLYQVATAGLSPAQIAMPIRRILARQKNATVLMEKVEGVDPTAASGRHRQAAASPTTISSSPPARATPISATTNGKRPRPA